MCMDVKHTSILAGKMALDVAAKPDHWSLIPEKYKIWKERTKLSSNLQMYEIAYAVLTIHILFINK